MKRTFDIFLSLFGILIFSPFIVLFSLLIKLQDGGPILFAQERWGKDGRVFKIYKFRTMIINADEKFGFHPAEDNDPRVTAVGKFLRATAMDELPQIFNILKGDMSFVGPRPMAVLEIDSNHPLFMERHKIRPGLTGPAQVGVARDVSFDEKLKYDLDYVRRGNFTGDTKLLFLSLWITLCGKWGKLHR
jgi:lipopolysaccharide/colanic/teichoic acid biosynthesis glycosyltransferase